jgi:hypothetical protein
MEGCVCGFDMGKVIGSVWKLDESNTDLKGITD